MPFAIPANIALIVNAILKVVGPGVTQISSYASAEAQRYAHAVDVLTGLYKSNDLSEDELKLHLQTQQNANASVLASIKGMDAVLGAQAMAAGVSAVAGVINTFVGVNILPI